MRYDYNSVKDFVESKGCKLISKEYSNCNEKLEIIDKNGHVFFRSFDKFKNSKRYLCPECSREISSKKRTYTYDYIKEYFKKNGFDLLTQEVKNNKQPLKIKCEHGHITYKNFDSLKNKKSKCSKCVRNSKYLYEEVKNFIAQEGYDLISTEYTGANDRIQISCKNKNHPLISTTFSSFKNGNHRCSKCVSERISSEQRHTYEYIENYFSSFRYKLISKEYVNNITPLDVLCDKGHHYKVAFNNFKKGTRCPVCYNKLRESKGVSKIKAVLCMMNIDFKIEKKFDDCKFKRCLPFDFYIPSLNIAIEFDGRQHFEIVDYFGGFEGFVKTKIRDSVKNLYCKENNIKLIRIPYYEIDNIENILKKEIY